MSQCSLLLSVLGPAVAVDSVTPQPADDSASAAYHDETRRAVDEVLAMKEFADLNRDMMSWWLSFLQWMEKFALGIGKFFSSLPGWLWWTIVIWMILTLVAILAHFAYVMYGMIVSSGSRRAAKGAAKEGRGELLGIRDLEFDSVYRRARELLAAGSWAEATKFLYVAAILWLDRQGLVKFRASKTNYDYLGELVREPERRANLRELTNRFEVTVYGGQPSTSTNCQEMSALVEVLLREAHPVVSH